MNKLNIKKFNLISYICSSKICRNIFLYFIILAMPTRIFQVKKRIRSNYLRLAQRTLWLCLKYFAYMQTIGKMCLHQVRILTFLLPVLLLCCIIKCEEKTFLNYFLSTLDIFAPFFRNMRF